VNGIYQNVKAKTQKLQMQKEPETTKP
jgi:hypothetical protein